MVSVHSLAGWQRLSYVCPLSMSLREHVAKGPSQDAACVC